jgi:hypothetical protein
MEKRFGFIALAFLLLMAGLAWAQAAWALPQGGEKPIEVKKFATSPVNLEKVSKPDINKQILRASISRNWTPLISMNNWPA